MDFVSHGIPSDIEKLSAAKCVDPHFIMHTPDVFPEIQIVSPGFVITVIGILRSFDVRLAFEVKFTFLSMLFTIRAINLQHESNL
jgi:hypothetical protein